MNNQTKLAFIARVAILFALYGVHLAFTKGYASNQAAYNDVKTSGTYNHTHIIIIINCIILIFSNFN